MIAESYERIHRGNLIGMGVLPLQFQDGQSAASLGFTGKETFALSGIASGLKPGGTVRVTVQGEQGQKAFDAKARLDTPIELEYYRHGGILPYVLRQLLK